MRPKHPGKTSPIIGPDKTAVTYTINYNIVFIVNKLIFADYGITLKMGIQDKLLCKLNPFRALFAKQLTVSIAVIQ